MSNTPDYLQRVRHNILFEVLSDETFEALRSKLLARQCKNSSRSVFCPHEGILYIPSAVLFWAAVRSRSPACHIKSTF